MRLLASLVCRNFRTGWNPSSCSGAHSKNSRPARNRRAFSIWADAADAMQHTYMRCHRAWASPGPCDMKMASLTSKPKLRFPFLDLAAQFANIREEVMDAVSRVLQAQQFILGPEVEKFESDVSAYFGSTDAVACASGSDALLLALMAHGLQAGDEIITTPFTFIATAGVPAHLRVRPVFVDIRPDTYNIDVKQIETAISSRTRAIIPVHLFGLSAEMNPLMELAARRGLKVIEDAAQAIGSQYAGQNVGTFGSTGCFSFFPSKNLGCAGDGGLVTTNDASIAVVLRLLRVHGSTQKYCYERLGVNSRLDALQAAILQVKLKYLP